MVVKGVEGMGNRFYQALKVKSCLENEPELFILASLNESSGAARCLTYCDTEMCRKFGWDICHTIIC